MKLLFSLQTSWLEVDLTTVIPCLEVSLLLTFTGSNVFRTALLELWLIPPSTYISLLYERVFIGCLSCIALSSRRPYWCTSFYIAVFIQNTLNLSLNPDTVCTERVEINLRLQPRGPPTLEGMILMNEAETSNLPSHSRENGNHKAI